MSDSLEEWQARRRSLTRERFVATYRHPFLLRRPPRATAEGETGDFTEKLSFETIVHDYATGAPEPPAAGRLRGVRISPVAKAPGNPFPDRISVGRAMNCDVVLRDSTVSKLHAHFKVLGPAEAELTDVNSANGTRVNGVKVEPGKAVKVRAGDAIVFGTIAVQFLDAGKLYEIL